MRPKILDVYNPYLGYDAAKFPHKPPPMEDEIDIARRAVEQVMWKDLGAALGRVVMHAKRVRAGKAALSSPPRSHVDSPPHDRHEIKLRRETGES